MKRFIDWLLNLIRRCRAGKPTEREKTMTLDELMIQAQEARAAADLSRQKGEAVVAANHAYVELVAAQDVEREAAEDGIAAAELDHVNSQEDAIVQLEESQAALIAYVQGTQTPA